MLQAIRERLALLLIALLPFHALLVTALTKLIAGPDHAPLPALALWKEGVLAIVLCIACAETFKSFKKWKVIDTPDFLILALVVLSLPVTQLGHGDWKLYVVGFKYDFVPLLSFLILRRADWSKRFLTNLKQILIFTGLIVAAYGIAGLFLPVGFFAWIGYSDLHSVYQPQGPLPAFQQIGGLGLRRIQSTLSGPNQLGLWLLLPWAVLGTAFLARYKPRRVILRSLLTKLHVVKAVVPWWTIAGTILVAVAIVLSFSRAAWIAAFVVALAALWRLIPGKTARRAVLGVLSAGALIGFVLVLLAPSVIVRRSSSRGHIDRPIEAMRMMLRQPFGYGLGAAGPASNRVSDSCVYLDAGSDPSWAADRPDLCVFVGSTQVQPDGRTCSCPVIPENWYLQVGVELGIAGMILFVVLIVLLLRGLLSQPIAFLPFLGLSIAALFLHAWEDSAVAYSAWLLASTTLPVRQKP